MYVEIMSQSSLLTGAGSYGFRNDRQYNMIEGANYVQIEQKLVDIDYADNTLTANILPSH